MRHIRGKIWKYKLFHIDNWIITVTSSRSAGSISSSNTGTSAGITQHDASELNPQEYWDRLKVLRARCGLDNSQQTSLGLNEPAPTKTTSNLQLGAKLNDSSSSLSSNSSTGPVCYASFKYNNLLYLFNKYLLTQGKMCKHIHNLCTSPCKDRSGLRVLYPPYSWPHTVVVYRRTSGSLTSHVYCVY